MYTYPVDCKWPRSNVQLRSIVHELHVTQEGEHIVPESDLIFYENLGENPYMI
jgi:hypothetical protein